MTCDEADHRDLTPEILTVLTRYCSMMPQTRQGSWAQKPQLGAPVRPWARSQVTERKAQTLLSRSSNCHRGRQGWGLRMLLAAGSPGPTQDVRLRQTGGRWPHRGSTGAGGQRASVPLPSSPAGVGGTSCCVCSGPGGRSHCASSGATSLRTGQPPGASDRGPTSHSPRLPASVSQQSACSQCGTCGVCPQPRGDSRDAGWVGRCCPRALPDSCPAL